MVEAIIFINKIFFCVVVVVCRCWTISIRSTQHTQFFFIIIYSFVFFIFVNRYQYEYDESVYWKLYLKSHNHKKTTCLILECNVNSIEHIRSYIKLKREPCLFCLYFIIIILVVVVVINVLHSTYDHTTVLWQTFLNSYKQTSLHKGE